MSYRRVGVCWVWWPFVAEYCVGIELYGESSAWMRRLADPRTALKFPWPDGVLSRRLVTALFEDSLFALGPMSGRIFLGYSHF